MDHVGSFYRRHGESVRAGDGGGGSTPADFKSASDWVCDWIRTAFSRVAEQDPGDDRGGVIHAICLGLKPEVKTSVGVNVPGGLEDAITWAQRVDLWQSREGTE